MRTACLAARGLRGLCRWNQPGCIRFPVPGKFQRADRLPLAPLWFREGWSTQIILSSYGLRFCAVKRLQDPPEHRQGQAGRMERCDVRPAYGAARATEFSPTPDSWYKLGNLSHLSHCACPRFVTALTKTFSGLWGGRCAPGNALASILPGRSLLLASECPLYARAIVILF